MKKAPEKTANRSIDRHLRTAMLASGILVLGFGGWAVTTELSGAILASGHVVVDANVKKVQHPFGGVVSRINVKNGERVREGDVLMSLDPTVARANLGVITKNLDALAVRQERLEAERDGLEAIELPLDLTTRIDAAELETLMETELSFFRSRRSVRDGQRAQLQERILQSEQQIGGLHLQVGAFEDGIELISQELEGLEKLYTKKLVSVARLMQLRRDESEMRGSHGQAIAEIAQAKGRIAEVKLQQLQIDEDLRAEVAGELAQVREKATELVERKSAALDQLQRIDLRAPADGIVHELSAHTVGGVIEAGAALMLIVPDTGDLSIEARVEPQDRDQIYVGQPAILRLTAFNQRTTPELKGEVKVVAADLVEDARTGMQYYPIRISLMSGESAKLEGKALSPGMPVESFVQTGYRTVMSYLVKPLADYLMRAFRGD
jgi:HlyD family secretion protein